MKERVIIVCFTGFGFPHEKEFPEGVRVMEMHEALYKICKTYVITGIYPAIKNETIKT